MVSTSMRDGLALRGSALSLQPEAIHAFQAIFIGFAFAGLVASAFEMFTARKASFHLLQTGGVLAVASVPVIVFSAPFIILRNTILGRQVEGRPIPFVAIATVIAGFWSMACGQVVMKFAGGVLGV
jgi:hypothetical protein